MTLADRGEGKRLAHVLGAPLITVMRPGRAVLHEVAAVAATTADPQLRVELLERAGAESTQAANRRVAEGWTDEAIDEQPVRRAGGLFDLMTSRPLVEQFGRAQEHQRVEDDVLAVWLLLGLEFLLRAPLARVNPTLLADPNPNGNAIMYAAGFPVKPGDQPKSIQAHTVISRLGIVIAEFSEERQDDATFLIGLRNAELHGSGSPFEMDIAQWLPHFTRVVGVVCPYLGLDPADIVGEDIIAQGRSLVDAADRRLEHEVNKRIAAAKTVFSHLRTEEIEARRAVIPRRLSFDQRHGCPPGMIITAWVEAMRVPPSIESVRCPACNEEIPMRLQAVRTTDERLEEGEIVRDVVYIAIGLSCPMCDLELANTAEIRAAKITKQYVKHERETFQACYLDTFEPDYGND